MNGTLTDTKKKLIVINTFLTNGLLHFLDPFLLSLKKLHDPESDYIVDLNFMAFESSEVDVFKKTAKIISQEYNDNFFKLQFSINTYNIEYLANLFEVPPELFKKWKYEVEIKATTDLNYKWKLCCSAYLRYRNIIKSFNKIKKSVSCNLKNHDISKSLFIHTDIDTIFMQPFWNRDNFNSTFDFALYIRDNEKIHNNSVYGGLIIQKFDSKDIIFEQHKKMLEKYKANSWPRGFGQLTLGEALQKLIGKGANALNLNNWDFGGVQTSFISKSLTRDAAIIIGNSYEGRRRKENTSEDFLNFLDEQKCEISYSRECPSGMYSVLAKNYALMHSTANNTNEKKFPGKKVCEMAPIIQRISLMYECGSLIDYGGGKGLQYTKNVVFTDKFTNRKYHGLHHLIGCKKAEVYDPHSSCLTKKPNTADLVICTDVLEHIYIKDLPWVIEEIFSTAKKVVFLTIPCYLDRKILPNGLPCHITVRPPSWWEGLITSISSKYPQIKFVCVCWNFNNGKFKPYYYSNITRTTHGGKKKELKTLKDFGTLNQYFISFEGKPLKVARKLI